MKKFLILVIVGAAVIFTFFYLKSDSKAVLPIETFDPVVRATVTIGETDIDVEVANTPEKMALGLGGRESLPKGQGMLFPYGQKTPAVFWMKGMMFPIDVIWTSDDKVVQIDADVPNEPGVSDNNLKRYLPNELVDNVLEVPAGFAAEHGIEVGNTVTVH